MREGKAVFRARTGTSASTTSYEYLDQHPKESKRHSQVVKEHDEGTKPRKCKRSQIAEEYLLESRIAQTLMIEPENETPDGAENGRNLMHPQPRFTRGCRPSLLVH